MSVLQTIDLHKQYGKLTAVDQLNLSIDNGSVFGLLGPNGSGKTTALGMILDVIHPTSGSFLWFGEKPNHNHRKRVGAILEKPNFYPGFSAYKNLELACKIKEVHTSRIVEVIEQVGLSERIHDAFKTYSLGMKQRLAIASALLSKPEVLILDEPTNGLDPEGIADIRQLIIEIAQTGKTIVLASHLLDEVQKVCTEFAILRKGKLIYSGAVDADLGAETIIEVGYHDLNLLISTLQSYPYYKNHRIQKNKVELFCENGTSTEELNRFLTDHNIYAGHLIPVKKNLEQQFIEILSEHG